MLHLLDLAEPSRSRYHQTPLLSSVPRFAQSGITIGSPNQAAILGFCFEQPLAPKSNSSKALVPVLSREWEEHARQPPVTPGQHNVKLHIYKN